MGAGRDGMVGWSVYKAEMLTGCPSGYLRVYKGISIITRRIFVTRIAGVGVGVGVGVGAIRQVHSSRVVRTASQFLQRVSAMLGTRIR